MSDEDWDDGDNLKALADAAREAAYKDQKDREEAVQNILDEQGVRVGDVVEITWTRDRRFGNEDGHHIGEVEHLDGGFIYVQSGMRAVGRLHMPISGIRSIRVVERDGKEVAAVVEVSPPETVSTVNPFIHQSDQQANPFL